MNKHHRIWSYITGQPWLITKPGLELISQIASRQGDVEAVLAKRGDIADATHRLELRGNVALLPVRGPIFRYANLFTDISGATSVSTMATDFQAALDNPEVSAIILEIDSPGGEAAGINELAGLIRAGAKKKPVKAYVSNYGASAAYWLASGASEIVVDATAMLGSIGVVIGYQTCDDDGYLEIVSTISPKKRLDPSTDEGRSEIQARADDLAEVFASTVSSYRGLSLSQVIDVEGGLLIGAKAVAAGLADRIGNLEGLIAELQNKNMPRPSWPRASKAAQTATTTTKGEDMTPDELRAAYPAACQEIYNQGQAAATATEAIKAAATQAATAERTRIEAVLALGKKPAEGSTEASLLTMALDGATTKEEAAYNLLTASRQRTKQAAADLADDAADIPVIDTTGGEAEPTADERKATIGNMVAGARR